MGSSNYITNLAGQITQSMPFGELLADEHVNSYNTPFKFNAKEYDAESGLYYYGARYYDPKWSMWLSVDPLAEEAPDWTPYRYGFHNPLKFIDPTGMIEEDHEYTVDKTGRVEKAKHVEGSTSDNLHTKDNWDKGVTSLGIEVKDQKILSGLSKERTDFNLEYAGEIHPGQYTTSNNFGELKKIFEFVSKNSNAEWALRLFKNGSFLGTNRYSESVAGYSPGFSYADLLKDYHSHPGTSIVDDKASGYSSDDYNRMAKNGFYPKNFGDLNRAYLSMIN